MFIALQQIILNLRMKKQKKIIDFRCDEEFF